MAIFQNQGILEVGVNFWGSKHGIEMWREWDAESVRKDVKALADLGIRVLRVFPDWSFFQPIERVVGYRGGSRGYSIDGGATVTTDKDEFSGINEAAMEAFSQFLDMAEEYGVKVIPSIITGWMSGRLFAPPALISNDPITDPASIKQQVRFIRAFVKSFRDRECIAAWCLGNECNCMGNAETEAEAWLWTSAVSDAIRGVDNSRPVISGMHSLIMPGEGVWTVQGQAEHNDILTTHPYASPSYRSEMDPIDTFRPLLHPVANTLMYRGVGGKPCIIEETGTFGEMYADEQATADYIRCCLYSSWAYDCRGYLWWIAFDQGQLTYHPFYTNNRASTYGVLHEDGTPKLRYESFREFMDFQENFGGALPPRVTDGVCILTRGQKSWPAVYHSFLLGKQAGLDLEYCFADDGELPESDLYIMPSIASPESVRADFLAELMARVEKGATLYVSTGDGLLRNLGRDFGVHIRVRSHYPHKKTLRFADGSTVRVSTPAEYDLIPETAEVLATDERGMPAFVCAPYGRGKVMWLTVPVESALYDVPGAFHRADADPFHKIYDAIADNVASRKWAKVDSLVMSVTEHIVNEDERILVCINCSPADETASMALPDGVCVEVLHGEGSADGETVTVKALHPLVLKLKA